MSALWLWKVLIMINQIKTIISEEYPNFSFDLLNWEEVIEHSSNVTVFYLKSSVEYYASYFEGNNLSFLIKENNKPIGVMPLFIYKNKEDWVLSTNGEGVIGPLFINNLPKKLKKRLERQIVNVVLLFADKLKIKKINFLECSPVLSGWYLLWLERSSRDFLTYHLAIDLSKSIEEIRLNFRKSYKPLVNKALREWKVDICSSGDKTIFEEFKLLHLEEAGRQTRSDESWDIQRNQILNDEAFLVTVRDEKDLVGGGFFTHTRDIGMYSVGAYKRNLFDKPIGHAVQMTAIEKLKEIGCTSYQLGQKSTYLSYPNLTDKELSISYFKEGFAGYVYAQPHLEVNI